MTQMNKGLETPTPDTGKGYADILNQYLGYTTKGVTLSFISPVYYAWYGHFYTGEYRDRRDCADFLKVINHLALVNPAYLDEIKLKGDLKALLNCLYEVFKSVETDYFADLKAIDAGYLQCLRDNETRGYYASLPDDFETIHEAIVHGDDQASAEAIRKLTQGKKVNGKLAYDLCQIRREMQGRKEGIDAQLKVLKKHIHHFAQFHGLESRIVKRAPSEQGRFVSGYTVASDERIKTSVSEAKQKARRIKKQNGQIANIAAFVVGLGEGLVAAAGMAALLPSVPFLAIFLVVGLAGWFCNYFLFRDDTEFTLKELRVHKTVPNRDFDSTLPKSESNPPTREVLRLFVNEKGEEISLKRKILCSLFGLCAIGTGVVYGSLSFVSVCASLPASFGVAALVLAAFPASATAIGLACILFTVISDFIKNDRWKSVVSYFQNTYGNRPWAEMSGRDWARYVCHVAFNLFKLALGMGINAVITVASLGLLHGKAVQVLSRICSYPASNVIGWGAAIMNAMVHLPFGIKYVMQPIEALFDWTRKTYATLSSKKGEVTPLQLQEVAQRPLNAAKKIGGVAAVANGAGQAALVAQPLLSNLGQAVVIAGSGLIYSAGPNFTALKTTLGKGEILPTSTQAICKRLKVTPDNHNTATEGHKESSRRMTAPVGQSVNDARQEEAGSSLSAAAGM